MMLGDNHEWGSGNRAGPISNYEGCLGHDSGSDKDLMLFALTNGWGTEYRKVGNEWLWYHDGDGVEITNDAVSPLVPNIDSKLRKIFGESLLLALFGESLAAAVDL